jgi:hypothetical protein
MTKTTDVTSAEVAALRSVERAARAVVHFPNDVRPKQALSRALQRLDRARQEDR